LALDAINSIRPNDKVLRVVEYLKGLARVNAKTVRKIDEYRKVLWLHRVPRESGCFTLAWGRDDEDSGDVWVEVSKKTEPVLPKVPDGLTNWVKPEQLRTTTEIPELYQTITIRKEEPDEDSGEVTWVTKTLVLDDFPEVRERWDAYLEKEWLPWAETHECYASVQSVYADLFHIHQDQQKLGEQYELVLGLGLLKWLTPTGQQVRRHLVTAKAFLEFEPHLGKFTVCPSTNEELTQVEFDMLDVEDQPENTKSLKEEGRELGYSLWNRSDLDQLLHAIANSLSDRGHGQYYPDLLQPTDGSGAEKPVVEFAPALILRRRSPRALEQVLDTMKGLIASEEMVPDVFLDLCESLEAQEGRDSDVEGVSLLPPGSEIYFPLLANEEQRRIILELSQKQGVLVQGPPGTGKSHTIANLICHLLATGSRVLVTAKTPRALQVLHDKLPKEIKPLCISLLGSDTDERESLERSVAGILEKLDGKQQAGSSTRLRELEKRIRANRGEKTIAYNKLGELRESETFEHVVAGGSYQGTAANIAAQLREEEQTFSWLEDRIPHDIQLPLSEKETTWLSQAVAEFDQEMERQLNLFIPDPDSELPAPDTARKLFRNVLTVKQKLEPELQRLQSAEARSLKRAPADTVEKLLSSLEKLVAEAQTLRQSATYWIPRAVDEVLSDKHAPWKELLQQSKAASEGLHDIAALVASYEISIPVREDRKKLLRDAEAIKSHLEQGGSLGFWFIKPEAVREHGAFIGTVKVDGQECSKLPTVQKLIDYLTVEQRIKHIWSLWAGRAVPQSGTFPIQVAEIEARHEALSRVLKLRTLRERVIENISKVRGLSSPKWSDSESLSELMATCRAVLVKHEAVAIQKELQAVQDKLHALAATDKAHPIVDAIDHTFTRRDIDRYCQLIDETKELRLRAEMSKKKLKLIQRLSSEAPKLASALTDASGTQQWSERLKNLEKAWSWARANSWLNDFLSADSESLERHSRRLEADIRKDLAALAATRAWDFCFSRIGSGSAHSRHLEAWRQAMKKLGKGKGKYANVWRREAQRHLNECRDAIPAWVMPLHRVYETVGARPGTFDVVIVDEASQCGPESLPLLYIGKRIVVVGDDKQISPEAVGVNRGPVQRLMRDHLYDFAHADSFDVENSLFDHGRLRFGKYVTLREHFRCMPEIIRFSNDLCYGRFPLIPLRQYPPDRLEPLMQVYVESGYREGSGPRVINRPEAEALVDAIERCCSDPRYQGMTMGVIVLQGESQAYIIQESLLRRLGTEQIAERRLICGNPYSFQGDERDVIFLSLVAARNERIGPMADEADRRRFNVAASRAQEQMWLFHSVTDNDLSEWCFRRRLLRHFYDKRSQIDQPLDGVDVLTQRALRANRLIEKPPEPFESWFEVDVALDIASHGYRVVPQFPFAEKRIDLMVQGTKAQLAVECDGEFWHGAEEFEADTRRQRKLERCGLSFFRVRESHYRATPDGALAPLWATLDDMGIFPVDREETTSSDHQEETYSADMDLEEEAQEENGREENGVEPREDGEEPIEASDAILRARTGHIPSTIQEALQARHQPLIGRAIIETLRERRNSSCVRSHMPTLILKHWQIRTRGMPRQQFAKRVDDMIAKMERKGYVTIYKSKNIRIKLGWLPYPDLELDNEKPRQETIDLLA